MISKPTTLFSSQSLSSLFVYVLLLGSVFYFRYGTGMQLKNMDFQSYYSAGVAIRGDINPYKYQALNDEQVRDKVIGEVQGDGFLFQHTREPDDLSYPYLYAPTLAIALSWGDFYMMRELWAGISLVALMLSLLLLEKSLSRYFPRWMAITISTFFGVAGPFLFAIYIGQIDVLIFFTFMLLLYGLTSEKRMSYWLFTGLLAGVVFMIKPHGLFLIFLLPLFGRGGYLGAILGLLIGFVIPTLFYPEPLVQFVQYLAGGASTEGLVNLLTHKNSSLTAMYAVVLDSYYRELAVVTAMLVGIVGVVFSILYAKDKKVRFISIYSIITVSFLLFTPYLWFQHYTYFLFSYLLVFVVLHGYFKFTNWHFLPLLIFTGYYSAATILIERTEIGFVKVVPAFILVTIVYFLYLLYKNRSLQTEGRINE